MLERRSLYCRPWLLLQVVQHWLVRGRVTSIAAAGVTTAGVRDTAGGTNLIRRRPSAGFFLFDSVLTLAYYCRSTRLASEQRQ